jgi:hypothetical protein
MNITYNYTKKRMKREKYVSLKEFITTCEKFFGHLTYREICYLYVGFDDYTVEQWNNIAVTEAIVIFVQNYITYMKKEC